jgi:hypothetical protein
MTIRQFFRGIGVQASSVENGCVASNSRPPGSKASDSWNRRLIDQEAADVIWTQDFGDHNI